MTVGDVAVVTLVDDAEGMTLGVKSTAAILASAVFFSEGSTYGSAATAWRSTYLALGSGSGSALRSVMLAHLKSMYLKSSELTSGEEGESWLLGAGSGRHPCAAA